MLSNCCKVKYFYFTLPYLCVLTGVLWVCYLSYQSGKVDVPHSPQCAHWSVYRCCQIHGVPVDMAFLLEQLPPTPKGHSLWELSNLFHRIGFITEGRKETFESLSEEMLPCIAHLKNPNHFVVISHVDDQGVHVFDGEGRRTFREWANFSKNWDGIILVVRNNNLFKPFPFQQKLAADVPLVRFESLLIDLGTVPSLGKPVQFDYHFQNIGRSDLIIEHIQPDCSCVNYEKTDNPIEAGQKGTITLFYNVQDRKGSFSHNILVKTNDPYFPAVILNATGWSGLEVTVSPKLFFLTNAICNQEIGLSCLVKYTGERKDLSVVIEPESLNNCIFVSQSLLKIDASNVKELLPELSVGHGNFENLYLMRFKIMPNGNIGDPIDGLFVLKTNIPSYENFNLLIAGQITSPFQFYPSVLHVDELSQQYRVKMVSRLEGGFRILDISTELGSISTDYCKDRIDSETDIDFYVNDFSAITSFPSDIFVHVESAKTSEKMVLPISIMTWNGTVD